MLTIHCLPTYRLEREYICKVLFNDFLAIEYRLCYANRKEWCIEGTDGRCIFFPDIFFQTQPAKWLTQESMAKPTLSIWDSRETCRDVSMVDNKISVIYGDLNFSPDNHLLEEAKKKKILPIDIFGSAFFMLTRYEEVVKKDCDEHDRFPATASLAYQEGFLERPIVNEYFEILWTCMKHLWPGLKRKRRTFQMRVSCDVDHPYQESVNNIFRQVKHIGGDLVIRRSPRMAVNSTFNYIAAKAGNFSFDANYVSIDWIMDVNERVGNKVAFYFKAGQTDDVFDSEYTLEEAIVQQLLYSVYQRGHEIGLHPSYHTYRDKKQLCREAEKLRYTLNGMGIQQNVLGGRQHYLRWETPTTARNWEAAGLAYDSTLSFADHAGFRCGVCYEYPIFDLNTRKTLRVKERPLIIMDRSVIDAQYTNFIPEVAVKYMLKFKEICRKFHGDFTLLWHNSFLTEHQMRQVYIELLND